MRRLFRRVLLAAAVLPSVGAAQDRPAKLQLRDYLDWEEVQSPLLSPDGARILFTRRWIDQANDKWESSVWMMKADGSQARFLVNGSAAAWSPDGTRIAYVAKGEPTGSQIFVRYMDAEGAVTQISRLTDAPSSIEWSPDGKTIAFSMNVPAKRDDLFARVTLPAAPKGAKWTEAPKVVTRLDYRQDRVGFVDEAWNHVFIIDAGGGTPRQVTNGDWNHGAAVWLDNATLLFTGKRVPNAEHIWRDSEIYAADLKSGAIRELTHRRGPDGSPAPSPDGKKIAYVGFDSTDATWKDAALYVMDADGSNPRALTAALDRSPSGLIWSEDNSTIYFTAENEGSRHLYATTLAGQVKQLTTGAQLVSVSDIRNGMAVAIRSASQLPNDVVRFSVKAPSALTQLTSVNADVLDGKQLGAVEEVWYKSKDGLRIQGWIVKPPDFSAAKKYPLMLSIHGGPHSMYNVAFNFAFQEHASNGFVTLYVNPRGSTGYGSTFGNAIKNAYPDKDFDDLMAGVDTVIGRGYIDTRRLFVYGCSGGGVLTAWTVGHTDRFAAASSNCPVINWMSFVGVTDGPSWYRNFEKPFWVDPTEYLKRSPIMYVGNVKTPTMLMTGVLDLRTPMPQTEEYYEALRFRGVPTAMVRFNNEWHGTSSTPSNFLRTQAYLRAWFDRHGGPVTP
ncbi:MAG: S9 family peptidase [Gemmatimonadetes bacterium]|nr:S9 family peptidase [Gemmatimonadota bacterium]